MFSSNVSSLPAFHAASRFLLARLRRVTVPLSLLCLAGCFELPHSTPSPRPEPSDQLTQRVQVALKDHPTDAFTYAGLYAVLADQIAANHYQSTSEAAAVAGRAAEILQVPGVLREVVDDELNPLLGTSQPLTPELCEKASAKLHSLSIACKEAAR